MPFVEVHEHKIHYRDEGKGEIVFVIVHGTPTSSAEFEDIISRLSAQFRFIAIDHLGFGESDKPRDGDYRLQTHQQRLIELLKQLNLFHFHLIVHDFGGAIGLPLAFHKDFQVKSITLLNTWFWPIVETEPQIKDQKWLVRSGILTFMYRHLNFSARFLLKFAWGQETRLTKERHRFFMGQFPTPKEREGTVGFLCALFDFDNSYWHQTEMLSRFDGNSVLIIWGGADPLLSVRNFEKWKKIFPEAKVYFLPKVGHFVAEESSEFVANCLKSFVKDIVK